MKRLLHGPTIWMIRCHAKEPPERKCVVRQAAAQWDELLSASRYLAGHHHLHSITLSARANNLKISYISLPCAKLFRAPNVVRSPECTVYRSLTALAILATVEAMAMPMPTLAQSRERTKVGTLTCDISAGIGLIIASKREVTCMFTPSRPGPREVYTGTITKFGFDVGATTGGNIAGQCAHLC